MKQYPAPIIAESIIDEAQYKVRRVYEIKEELFNVIHWLERYAHQPPEPHLDNTTLEYRTIFPAP